MTNLLKSDFYKLFRMKSFYVCCIVAMGIGFMQAGMPKLMLDMINSQPDLAKDALIEVSGLNIKTLLFIAVDSSNGNWILLAIIAIALFVTIEYSSGTLKNIAARGFSRESIFFSKYIVSIIESLIICIVYALVYIVFCLIFFGSDGLDGSFFKELAATYAIDILVAIASSSVIIMIAFLLRSKGGTIAISIAAYIILIPTILQLINIISVANSDDTSLETAMELSSNQYGDFAPYWIGTLSSATRNYYADNTLYIPILISLAYIGVSIAVGFLVFKKRDIK